MGLWSFLSSHSTSTHSGSTPHLWRFWRWLGLSCWVGLWLMFPAHATVLLRIGIEENVPQITLGSSIEARVLDAQGSPVAAIEGMKPLTASVAGNAIKLGSTQGDRLYLQPTAPDGLVFISGNWYRGLVELVMGEKGLIAVNQVGLDDYVSSVIGSEMGHRFPTEALKSQAVASRSYALFHRNLRLGKPFDLGDDQTWQVYKGVIGESNLTQAAARETANQVLTYQNQIINSVFHSSSGGHTEDVENVWLEPLPYLIGVPDFDADAPVFSWTETFSSQQIEQIASGIGRLRNVEVTQRTPNGRATQVKLMGTEGDKQLSAGEFRLQMGLKSTLFSIYPQGGSATTASLVPVAGAPTHYQIKGRGFGHGIGMSQWGASGLAKQGWTYQQILAHYYRGAHLAVVELE